MKRIFAYILCLLFLLSINSYAGWTDWVKPGGTASINSYTDIVGKFGSGSCSGYLKSDGTCDSPAGAGDVVAGTMGTTGQYCTKNAATKTIDCNTTPSFLPASRFVFAGAANITTFTGNYSLGITLTGNTSVTFPTSGTLATTTLKPSDLAIASQAAGDIIYFNGTNWVRLAKDAGKYLKSGDSAVSWDSPSGSGDVTDVGDCSSGACFDGSSDGGTYLRLYDGTSAYTGITAGVRTLTFAPSNANAENMTVTFGDNNNTVSIASGTGATVNISGTATNLSGTPTLPNGTRATTQSAGDNSTKLATTAYANALVSDTAYDATSWNAVTAIAPSKNAVRDYLESKLPSGADGSYRVVITNNTAISPTASANELYPEANIWKVNQNGTESSICIAPTAGQVSFTGPTAARAYTLPDSAATIVTEGTATGGILLGDSTPDAAGELGFASNQLNVHDGTASRDILQVASTVITKTEYIPIAYAEDGGTAPSAAAVTASTRKVKTRGFSGSADQDVEIHWIAPLDYYAGVKFRVVGYVTASTAPADTEVVAFSLAGCSNGNSDALGCTVGTAQTSSLTVSGSGYAQYDRLATAYSSAITVTDIAAGESVHLKLIRLATSTDTYAQAFGVAGIEIKYQAKVNASGDY